MTFPLRLSRLLTTKTHMSIQISNYKIGHNSNYTREFYKFVIV